jgi:hypothetical protein
MSGLTLIVLIGAVWATGRCSRSIREFEHAAAWSDNQFFDSRVVFAAESCAVRATRYRPTGAVENMPVDVEKGSLVEQVLNFWEGKRTIHLVTEWRIWSGRYYFAFQPIERRAVGRFAIPETWCCSISANHHGEIAGDDLSRASALVTQQDREPKRRFVVWDCFQVINHRQRPYFYSRAHLFLNGPDKRTNLNKGYKYLQEPYNDQQLSISSEFAGVGDQGGIESLCAALALAIIAIILGSAAVLSLLSGERALWGGSLILLACCLAIYALGWVGGLWTWKLIWIGIRASYAV